ncbi:MAG: Ig-like domain-containing protein [Lachnospiraceae bacterium]|nr:Ig-like domain-containing protein [Lachnospiraceae bacterium]
MQIKNLRKIIVSLSFALVLLCVGVFGKGNTAHAEERLLPKLNVNSQELVKGEQFQLRVYNTTAKQKIVYKSSNDAIVSIKDTGMMTAVSIGTATVKVEVKEGWKTVNVLTCKVTVGPPALFVILIDSKLTMSLDVYNTYFLDRIVLPMTSTEKVTFFSEHPEIVSVSPTGWLTAHEVGDATVYAFIKNGNYSSCKVTVVDHLDEEEPIDFATFVSNLTKNE